MKIIKIFIIINLLTNKDSRIENYYNNFPPRLREGDVYECLSSGSKNYYRRESIWN